MFVDYVPLDYSSTKPDLVSFARAGRGLATEVASHEGAAQAGPPRQAAAGEFIRRVSDGTFTLQELRRREGGFAALPPTPVQDDVFRNRISLLVQQHNGIKSRENSARLRVLTDRIRALSPSVDNAQLDALSEIVEQTEVTSDRLAQIRQRFNLRA